MGALWALVEQHIDDLAPYKPSVAQVGKSVGYAGRQGIAGWQKPAVLPGPNYLRAFARISGYPYRVVLDAALTDCGWLAEGEAEPLPPRRQRGPATVDPFAAPKSALRDAANTVPE